MMVASGPWGWSFSFHSRMHSFSLEFPVVQFIKDPGLSLQRLGAKKRDAHPFIHTFICSPPHDRAFSRSRLNSVPLILTTSPPPAPPSHKKKRIFFSNLEPPHTLRIWWVKCPSPGLWLARWLWLASSLCYPPPKMCTLRPWLPMGLAACSCCNPGPWLPNHLYASLLVWEFQSETGSGPVCNFWWCSKIFFNILK